MKKLATLLAKRGPLAGVLFVATVKLLEVFGYAEAARGLATIGGVFGIGAELPADLVVGLAAGAAGLGAAYKSFMVSRAWLRTPSLKVLIAAAAIPMLVGASCGLPEIPIPIPTPEPVVCTDCNAATALTGVVRVKGAIPGRYVAVLKVAPRTSLQVQTHAAQVSVLEGRFGLLQVKSLSRVGMLAFRSDAKTAASLATDPSVQFVQQQGRHFISGLSWGLDRVDQRDLPLSGSYDPGADGAGVHVFIVDTGCPSTDLKTCRQDHPDFGARYTAEAFSAVTFGGVDDQNGHGTHVAGTAAGTVWGVAKGATLHAARVLDQDGSGTTEGVIAGIDYVTAWKEAHPGVGTVGNMSLGGSPDPALDAAVCRSTAAGVVWAVAAGNDYGADSCSASPARVVQAITMAASDKSDHAADFSNAGKGIDLYGPGADIESDRPEGGTATFSGTSMASPHAAGAAALFLQRHPGSTPAEVEAGLKGNASPGKIGTAPADTTQAMLYVKE